MARRNHKVGQAVVVERVVVVRKTTAIESQQARPDRKLARALLSHDPLAERVARAHDEHVQTAEQVEVVLQQAGLQYRIVSKFGRQHASWADLVVTVGGTGPSCALRTALMRPPTTMVSRCWGSTAPPAAQWVISVPPRV